MEIESLEPEMRAEGQVSRPTGERGGRGEGRQEEGGGCAAKQSISLQ